MARQTEITREEEENLTKLVFACAICNKVFKEPGMCDKCDVALKAKAD